jgi:type II secretory pathway component PulF
MVEQKDMIDWGSFLIGVAIIALIQVIPQIQQMYADNPGMAVFLNFLALFLSQIGSRIAISIATAETNKLEQ